MSARKQAGTVTPTGTVREPGKVARGWDGGRQRRPYQRSRCHTPPLRAVKTWGLEEVRRVVLGTFKIGAERNIKIG